ncbi:hypothetical protein [Haloarcula litorea]|uniref:hypothetical protein n=1 Tax=Haloarcula litorea TaxID=3032579 RepID=UPI0023E79A54|nr:hypothetical protein [Halomicroarcula sp. GDY20]
MDPRRRLAANVASESEAYGYTLAVWGSGALLIDAFGIPGVRQAMGFVGGALLGFGTLAVLAVGGISEQVSPSDSPSTLVVSTVHIVATGGTLLGVDRLIEVVPGERVLVGFVAVGVFVTVTYNLLLLVEELAVELVTE